MLFNLEPEVVQIFDFKILRSYFETFSKTVDTESETQIIDKFSYKLRITQDDDDSSFFMIEANLSSTSPSDPSYESSESNEEAEDSGVTFDISALVIARLMEELPGEIEKDKFVLETCRTSIYSMLREYLYNLTTRGVDPAILLPVVKQTIPNYSLDKNDETPDVIKLPPM